MLRGTIDTRGSLLAAKSDALRFVDKEDSRGQGMKQFLDDKTYRPGFGAFKRRKAERA